MSFSDSLIDKLSNIYKRSNCSLDFISLKSFTENACDFSISKALSNKILDMLDKEDLDLIPLILEEYYKDALVVDVSLNEYPNLFNRRLYIPIRYNLDYFVFSILTSLRIGKYEDFYLDLDKRYTIDKENKLGLVSSFMLNSYPNISLVYGKDLFRFNIKIIGLTKLNDNEITLPFYVIDGVGYGIMGVSKYNLFSSFDESISISTETKNPLVDDEDFEFYDLNIDELNENSLDDFNALLDMYLVKQ